jgi:hypothetical protein
MVEIKCTKGYPLDLIMDIDVKMDDYDLTKVNCFLDSNARSSWIGWPRQLLLHLMVPAATGARSSGSGDGSGGGGGRGSSKQTRITRHANTYLKTE